MTLVWRGWGAPGRPAPPPRPARPGGTVWWRPVAPGWERSADFDELCERASCLLNEKFGGAPLWGWKDPRTTLTLPFWKELVPEARYVICLRSPADAISSIQRRRDPELSIGAWGDLWLEYTARAPRETEGCPRTFVFYEDFFHDSQRQLAAAVASSLGLQAPDQNGARQHCSRRSSRGCGTTLRFSEERGGDEWGWDALRRAPAIQHHRLAFGRWCEGSIRARGWV